MYKILIIFLVGIFIINYQYLPVSQNIKLSGAGVPNNFKLGGGGEFTCNSAV